MWVRTMFVHCCGGCTPCISHARITLSELKKDLIVIYFRYVTELFISILGRWEDYVSRHIIDRGENLINNWINSPLFGIPAETAERWRIKDVGERRIELTCRIIGWSASCCAGQIKRTSSAITRAGDSHNARTHVVAHRPLSFPVVWNCLTINW